MPVGGLGLRSQNSHKSQTGVRGTCNTGTQEAETGGCWSKLASPRFNKDPVLINHMKGD